MVPTCRDYYDKTRPKNCRYLDFARKHHFVMIVYGKMDIQNAQNVCASENFCMHLIPNESYFSLEILKHILPSFLELNLFPSSSSHWHKLKMVGKIELTWIMFFDIFFSLQFFQFVFIHVHIEFAFIAHKISRKRYLCAMPTLNELKISAKKDYNLR